jgi:uncharacterized membrane protein YgdD (TMEM256/DUF423 family)
VRAFGISARAGSRRGPGRATVPAMNLRFLGAVSGFLAVALGAFGAHALRDRLAADMLAVFETGVRYQFLHALALLVAGSTAPAGASGTIRGAGGCFVAGTVLFSGSLYALAFTGVRLWGAVTPLGGLCFLAGWALLAWAHRRS